MPPTQQSSLGSRSMINSVSSQSQLVSDAVQRIRNKGLSQRQQRLNRLWSWYRCQNYENRKYEWDGREALSDLDTEAVSSGAYIPPGFYDAQGAMLPVRFRKPSAPYRLAKVIVDRFTGLLFSEKRHPQVRVEGDEDTENFVQALVEASRMWATMMEARTYGGAQGTACVGFQFIEGRPVLEVHDPRWVHPIFKDRNHMVLRAIDKRYIYPMEERDPETGLYMMVDYWYRRTINEEKDVLYEPIPVGDGTEPNWEDHVQVEVPHALGFCPVVWVQNLPMQDEIDGDPDCDGAFEMIEEMDCLISQASRGTVANCDPTFHIGTDLPLSDVSKGTGNAIKTEKGGSAGYVEINGSGPKSAREMVQEFRTMVLEVTQCVLDHPDSANRTATEIERVYSSMLEKADKLKEQYGERCVKPLVHMMVKAARKLMGNVVADSEAGVIRRTVLKLPKRAMKDGDSVQLVDQKLGDGGEMKLQWPEFFNANPSEITAHVQAANLAKAGGILDTEHAANSIAQYFHVEDVPGMLERAKAEQQEAQDAMDQHLMQSMQSKASGMGMGGASVSGGSE